MTISTIDNNRKSSVRNCGIWVENKEIIFIRLPLKTLTQDSRLIGTLIIAQIHAAIFSFSDLPEHKRPGFSLYVDEFEHFATTDFSEMFTEGRKFGARVTIAHQYRGQLPEFLRASTVTARNIVCFQNTPEDGREMGHLFLGGQVDLKAEDIEAKPAEYLLHHGSDNPIIQEFVDTYLRPLQSQKRGGRIEIKNPGFQRGHMWYWALSVEAPKEKPRVADPIPYLNHLLYQVMKSGTFTHDIPVEIVYGFSNCGLGFFSDFRYSRDKARLLSDHIQFPPALVVEGKHGLRFTRRPENGKEQLYHFLFYLRSTMGYLTESPLGKKSSLTLAQVSRDLTILPKRAAYVRTGETTGVIYTDKTAKSCSATELGKRYYLIRGQTRQKYCKPKVEIETPMTANPEPVTNRWEEVK